MKKHQNSTDKKDKALYEDTKDTKVTDYNVNDHHHEYNDRTSDIHTSNVDHSNDYEGVHASYNRDEKVDRVNVEHHYDTHRYGVNDRHRVGVVHEEKAHRVGTNLSWSAVLGGLVTFIALSILFSLIGAAIGLGAPDVNAAKPLEGVGMGLIVWTLLSLVASLAAAGYVSGYLANRAGFVHGFLTWALGLIAATLLASSAVTGAFNAFGSLVGVTGNAVGDAVGTITQSAGNLSQEAVNAIAENLNVDTTNLDQDVQEVLKDSEIEQLQPNYLQGQLDETISDIQNAGKSVLVDGKPVDQAFQTVYDNIDQRVETIGKGLNEEELSNAIAENSDLSQQEADEAVTNIKESYSEAQTQAKEGLETAKTEIAKLQENAGQTVKETANSADNVMDEASKYSVYAFIGSLLGMLLSSFAGRLGAKKGHEEDERVLSVTEEEVVR